MKKFSTTANFPMHHIRLPKELADKVKKLALKERRDFTNQVIVLLEAALKEKSK